MGKVGKVVFWYFMGRSFSNIDHDFYLTDKKKDLSLCQPLSNKLHTSTTAWQEMNFISFLLYSLHRTPFQSTPAKHKTSHQLQNQKSFCVLN